MENEQQVKIIPEEKKIQEQSILFLRLTRILILVSVVILVFIIIFQAAIFLLGKKLAKEQSHLNNAEVNALFERVEKISQIQQKIEEMKSVLVLKYSPVEVLTILEEATLPKVYWSNFSFNQSNNLVSLVGSAPDYETAGQQILILKKFGFEKKTISNFSLGKNNQVKFGGQFNFNFKAKNK